MSTAIDIFNTDLPLVIEDSKSRANVYEKNIIGDVDPYRINSILDNLGSSTIEDKEDVLNTANSFVSLEKQTIFPIPKRRLNKKRAIATQSWEGYVVEVYKSSFTARLVDMFNKHPDEDIEIKFTSVSPDDKYLIKPGAIFYWNVGYEVENRTVKGISIIKFRRLPRWTKKDFQNSELIKQEIEKLFEE
jgi:hypothetical protein